MKTLGNLPKETIFSTLAYCVEADDMPNQDESIIVFKDVPAKLIEVKMSSLANVSAIGHFGGFMMGLLIGLFYFNIIFNKETKVNPIQENKITEEKSLIIIQ